jgi:plasmid maintenance system killer protein
MIIEYQNEEIQALVNHRYIGQYKPYRSNSKLLRALDKVIRYLEKAKDINGVAAIRSLAYHPLTGSPNSSVRVGYETKYRLIFKEQDDKLTLLLIELNEHYGDH